MEIVEQSWATKTRLTLAFSQVGHFRFLNQAILLRV